MSLIFDVSLPRRNFLLDLRGEFGKETVGVYGPSGAGKTSLFNVVAGLEQPSRGTVTLNGRVLTDVDAGIHLPPNRRRIGVVFQEKLLFPHLSVRENLLFGTRYVSAPKVSLETVVELLDLSAFLDSMPAGISGGEEQRTAIGRALLTSPELLLLDEPFSAVDQSLRRAIIPYLRKVRDELDIPLLVISHDLPDIQRLTSQIYLIEAGRCGGYGNILDLFGEDHPQPDGTRLVNTLRLRDPRLGAGGVYHCSVEDAPGIVVKTAVAPAEHFTLTVQPNEIALARTEISGISIQNQLLGTVERMYEHAGSVYCVVNTGVRLLAKVTPAAVDELGIVVGSQVCCLFKAQSLSR